MTASEAAGLTRYSDPVEGRWEVGNELYAVSLWEDGQSVEQVLRWVASDNQVIPQAVACLAALAYKTSNVRIANWRNIIDSPVRRPDRLINVFPMRRPYR